MSFSKRIIALLLSTVMLFSLAGCNINATPSLENDSSLTNWLFDDNTSQLVSSNDENSKSDNIAVTENKKPVGTGIATKINLSSIPSYSGVAFIEINNGTPNFSVAELKTVGYENYSSLDEYGRCGVALASCGKDTMHGPSDERKSTRDVYPTGWKQAKYDGISGGYLWNRCHLIGWQLSAENANKLNLITGTRYMNIEGMLRFENIVADYIKESEKHVAYRISPIYDGDNLVCSGVQMEAYSIEDNGEGICFNVYCYNVQPGITINYADGSSSKSIKETKTSTPLPVIENDNDQSVGSSSGEMVWIPNTGFKYHTRSSCSNMKNPSQVTKTEAINRGYEPCKKCY